MQLSKLRTYLSCVTPFSISELCTVLFQYEVKASYCHVPMYAWTTTVQQSSTETWKDAKNHLDLIKKHEEVAWHLTHGVIRTFAPLIRSYRIISSFRSYSFVLFRPLCHHRRCQHGVSFYASFVQLRSKRLLLNCLFLCQNGFSSLVANDSLGVLLICVD
jgi:hypothetical protein